ncbi:TPA: ead/Ea22-like family protein [Escherichia coli]
MTTDITKLAQSLKAAAEKAGADDWQTKKISGEFYVIRKGSYSSKCGYRAYQPIAEIDHKSTRDYVAIASPANILALVEALEKAQQYAKERDAENQDLMLTVGRLRVEREELESRTVKLPERYAWQLGYIVPDPNGDLLDLDDVIAALAAAGIKVEAE